MEKQIKATNWKHECRYESMSDEKRKCTLRIHKNYPSFRNVFINRDKGMDAYKVWDKEKFNGKILPEKQKIGEFEAQKAVTEFAGRKWTAWFHRGIALSRMVLINLEDY